MKQIWLIACKEFGDRFRSGWVLACVAVWLAAIVITSFFGLVQIGRMGVQGYERTVMSLLNLVQYLVPLLALLLGHDLIAGEREDRTLLLVIASGVSRARLLLGKLIGGCLTLAFPLALGFGIAGIAIGIASRDPHFAPFVLLGVSALALATVFLSIGVLVSTLCRSRVQSLVFALLTWCASVFVFDLIALGVLVSIRAPVAIQEIEVACDATHVNAAADVHAAFDAVPDAQSQARARANTAAFSWIYINPIDLFRAVNLSAQTGVSVPTYGWSVGLAGWLCATILISTRMLKCKDL